MLRALEVIPDISEDELARGLRVILDVSVEQQSGDTTLTQLDGRNTTYLANPELDTLLQSYLGRLIAYPSSPSLLRMAIRNHMNNPEHLTHTLTILSCWISSYIERDDILFVEAQPLLYQKFHTPLIEDTEDTMPPIDMVRVFLECQCGL